MESPQNENIENIKNISSSQEKPKYQPKSPEEIKQQNIESKNTEKIRELENQMSLNWRNKNKEEIDALYKQTLNIYEE